MKRITALSSSFCLAETWLIDRNQKQIILSAQMAVDEVKSGFFDDNPEFWQLEIGKGLPGETWASGKVEFWPDLKNHPKFLRQAAAEKAGLLSAFGIPLRYNGHLVGVLLLGQPHNTRTELLNDALLSRLGDHLGSAITRRQLENDLHDIFEAAHDIICIIGTDRYFKKVNPAMCTLLGYTETELLTMQLDDLVHPEDLAKSQERMGKFITGELTSVYFENRYRNKNGNIIDLAWTAAKGNEKHILYCVAKNISDKKELEKLLQKASQLARIGSWEFDLKTGQIFWSPITADILDINADFKPLRSNVSRFFNAPDWKKLVAGLSRACKDNTQFDIELEIVSAKKHPLWVRILGEGEFNNGKCVRIYGSVQDIDVRKRAELAATGLLTERNSILESIGDAFFSLDCEWKILYWNSKAEQVLQKPKNKVIGKNLWKVFKTAVGSLSYIQYHEALTTGEPRRFEDHYPLLDKWYDINVYPSQEGLSVFFKDITSRKLAERELSRQAAALEISREQYEDLFQLSPLPKFVFDTQTMAYLDVNKAAVNHYGYTKEEFLSMTLRDIRPASELERLENVISDSSRETYFFQPGNFIHRKKNGELITVEITSSAIMYNDKPARIALAVDITDQMRNLEAIKMQNQKLRDIAWIQSHNIRGPLSRIMGLVGLLENNDLYTAETAEILQFIQASAIQLDNVIRSLPVNSIDETPFN